MQPITNEQDFETSFEFAEQARNSGDLLNAIKTYQKLLFYRLKAINQDSTDTFSNYDAIITERLGDLAWLFGLHKITERLFTGLQGLSVQSDNQYLKLYLSLKLAILWMDAGDLEKARNHLEVDFGNLENFPLQEFEEWEKTYSWPFLDSDQRGIIKTRLYYVVGGIYLRLGRYTESILYFNRAKKISKQHRNKMITSLSVPSTLGICQAHLEKGGLQVAGEALKEAAHGLDKKITSGNYIRWLELDAKTNMLIGNFGKSKKIFEEILILCSKHNLVNGQINALCNLSSINIYLNQISIAEVLLHKAYSLTLNTKDKVLQAKIKSLQELAILRSSSPISGASVLPSFFQSITKRNNFHNSTILDNIIEPIQTDYFLQFFDNKTIIFQRLLGDFEFSIAARYLKEITEEFKETDSQLIKNRLIFFKCLLAYYQKEVKNIEELQAVQNYYKEQGMIPELWDLQRLIGWLNKDNPVIYKSIQQENYLLLQKMTSSLSIEEQAIYLLNKWTSEEENLATKITTLETLKNQRGIFKKITSNINVFLNLNKLLNELEAYKSAIVSKVIKSENDIVTMDKIQWLKRIFYQPYNRLEIHYLILPDRALVIYSGFLILDYEILTINRLDLRAKVSTIHDKIATLKNSRGIVSRPTAKILGDLSKELTEVMAEMAKMLNLTTYFKNIPSRIKKIVFIPDDALHGLPFTLLPFKNKYLIENFAISLNYKSSPIKFIKPVKRNLNNALLIGLTYRKSNLSFLPGVKGEINALKRILENQDFLITNLDDETTKKSTILSSLHNKKLLHIAGHGTFNSENPNLSGLILPNDEYYTLSDIWQDPNLSKLEHVTLSSCWAADNFILPNKWILSLPETFLRAGVGSVLGCYWEVSDRVAEKMMSNFYQNLFKYPRDVALQKTIHLAIDNKLDVENIDTSNPIYWSGFTLFGQSDFF